MTTLSQQRSWVPELDWRFWALLIAAPLAIASYETIGDKYWLETLGVGSSFLFHLGHALVPWWITAAMTKLVMEGLHRWKPNLLILTILGAVLGNLATSPYIAWWTGQFLEQISVVDPAVLQEEAKLFGTQLQIILQWTHAGVIWVLVNFLFDRYLGLRLYRYESAEPTLSADTADLNAEGNHTEPGLDIAEGIQPEPAAPRFLSRATTALSATDIYALKAEEHYVRIFTKDREELVLYRFSDAVAEMGTVLGLQVHRSYWVAEDAIDHVQSDVRKMTLTLKSGEQIPVSARYQELVRQRIPESDMS